MIKAKIGAVEWDVSYLIDEESFNQNGSDYLREMIAEECPADFFSDFPGGFIKFLDHIEFYTVANPPPPKGER